jgi:hypothetical protein
MNLNPDWPVLRPVLVAAYNGSWAVLEVLLNHRAQALDALPTVQLDVQVHSRDIVY